MARQSFAAGGLLSSFLVLCWACSSDTAQSANTTTSGGGMAGLGGNTAGTQAIAGSGTGGAAAGAAGSAVGMSGGGSGATGGAAGAAAGAAGNPSAGAGGASGGGAGGAGGASGAGGAAGAAGAGVTASCADHPEYDLCIDFESGIDAAVWEGGNENSIDATHFAHGGNAYHLYSCTDPAMPTENSGCDSEMNGGKLTAMNLGNITDQIWGRVYVHFAPGAPGGHGNLIEAYDQSDAWYEMGWQFDGFMGVWHAPNGNERPLRSTPYVVDQWYCLEFFFDGTQTEMPQWWLDGEEAMYHMAANEGLTPTIVTQFDRIGVGFTPYAGLGIRQPDGVGDQTEMRLLTDLWVDSIAFDTERIGCVTGPIGQ